jgi:hypothetical protein
MIEGVILGLLEYVPDWLGQYRCEVDVQQVMLNSKKIQKIKLSV